MSLVKILLKMMVIHELASTNTEDNQMILALIEDKKVKAEKADIITWPKK